jgi:nitrate/nitrite-specific signal transduction histidine kinase
MTKNISPPSVQIKSKCTKYRAKTLLISSFILLVLLITLSVGTTSFLLLNEIIKEDIPSENSLKEISSSVNLISYEILEYIFLKEKEAVDEIHEEEEKIEEMLSIYESIEINTVKQEQIELLLELKRAKNQLTSKINEIIDTYDNYGLDETNEALEEFELIQNKLTIVIKRAQTVVDDRVDESLHNFYTSLILSIIISLMIASVAALLIAKKISNPIEDLTFRINRISKGEFDLKIRESNIVEIKDLTDSLNRILASMKLSILRKEITKKESPASNIEDGTYRKSFPSYSKKSKDKLNGGKKSI